jgi:hypothetical protein
VPGHGPQLQAGAKLRAALDYWRRLSSIKVAVKQSSSTCDYCHRTLDRWNATNPQIHYPRVHGLIEREVIARGVFTSVPDLRRKLMRCIRAHRTPALSIPHRRMFVRSWSVTDAELGEGILSPKSEDCRTFGAGFQ